MKGMPKDETIEKWIKASGSKEAFEKDMLKRLDFVEKDYKAKKNKLQYIIKRLKSL